MLRQLHRAQMTLYWANDTGDALLSECLIKPKIYCLHRAQEKNFITSWISKLNSERSINCIT